ncbi:ImmA/IrrE family metallo-endopeptidase [Azospirillum rugosum]|uniref:Zn-dependent peptidase ImmA (M78 family) n=1 Tax=Azospirillum rugosum TaxID=416170 RepID=A0ABS4SKI2_9PROT|nr:ImmA/IrrE family metallo-endopeptidase [Azospirillum rugosum]MBP2292462.1 Zn-dependent peptidase ImmA (M78 family) [Azospirillum rugosum]MDQ0526221.1 Zn-dependent peptidase ImmA (M78 family) [Azospirillum rugosum]
MTQNNPVFDLSIRWDNEAPAGTAFTATAGEAVLRVGTHVVWGRTDDLGVHWHWIDLLAFLSENWLALTLEQHYPLPVKPFLPHLLRATADRRWEMERRAGAILEERYLDEEEKVFWFENRHNIARAVEGLVVPDVFVMRQNHLIVVSGKDFSEYFDYNLFVQMLTGIGNQIADRLRGIDDPIAVERVREWDARLPEFSEAAARLYTGASGEFLRKVAANDNLSSFYNGEYRKVRETPILAAARMAWNASMSPESARTVLTTLRRQPKVSSPDLERLRAAKPVTPRDRKPAQAGRELAEWLHKQLFPSGLSEASLKAIDPAAILMRWDVPVIQLDFADDGIDAVSCWGEELGPVVLLNAESSRNRRESGKRATLAHEICHLIFDYHNGLPFADVVGGVDDDDVEKRARAFAAEFLLPSNFLANRFSRDMELGRWVESIALAFNVSNEIVVWQLKRSKIEGRLSDSDKAILRQYVSSPQNLF